MITLKQMLAASNRITILTGAGVSTDSGVPDFRQSDANWPYPEPRQELMSAPYFRSNPLRFWRIYREVFSGKLAAEPNHNHYWLASLEDSHRVTIITQNVEGLHQKAGSTDVIEVHGNSSLAHCVSGCTPVHMTAIEQLELPRCENCNAILKPSVSLFMDGVHGMGEARDATVEADLFIVMGTSLAVGPVNELPYYAGRPPGAKVLWLNREEPPESHAFVFTHKWLGELKELSPTSELMPGEASAQEPSENA